MRDVVIVGGGLSGMAAAVELEQHNINYTIIEVKERLGGSLNSISQAGFTIDTGPFVFVDETGLHDILADYDLTDALYSLNEQSVVFKDGIKTLLATLEKSITAPRMRRMAVSSIGEIDGRFALCMENGLMFDAKSLILAVPARFAERMFYGYIPDIAHKLLEFHYDSILRVSVGCSANAVNQPIKLPPDMAYPFIHQTDHPSRTPPDSLLLQIGVRVDPANFDDMTHVLPEVIKQIKLQEEPIIQRVDHWREADLLSCHDDDHLARLQFIKRHLPAGITLIGSDYSLAPPSYRGVFRLAERIRQGQVAARQMVAFLSDTD